MSINVETHLLTGTFFFVADINHKLCVWLKIIFYDASRQVRSLYWTSREEQKKLRFAEKQRVAYAFRCNPVK